MSYRQFELPDQSVIKKDERWHVEHGNLMIQYIGGNDFSGRLKEIGVLEQDYLATPKKRASMTDPHGWPLGVKYEVYPLIEGIIDDVVGKYLSRPPERTAYSINRDAINAKLNSKIEMLMEQMFRAQHDQINQDKDLNLQTDNPDMQMPEKVEVPEDIEEFFSKTYKTNAEELVNDILDQFLEVNKNNDRIKPMLIEYLYGETACGEIYEKNGHPMLRTHRYDECYFDIDPKKEVQDDIETFASFVYMSETEILNKYALTQRQRNKVKQAFKAMDEGTVINDPIDLASTGVGYANCNKGVSYAGWMDINKNSNRLRVLNMMWKSRRDIRTLTYVDKKTNKEVTKLLDQDYKERKRDKGKITVTSVQTVHHIDMLGPEVVLDWGELEERHPRIDNPSQAYLPVVSLVGKTYLRIRQIRSLAQKLKSLQQFASDILYQMRIHISGLDGKVLVYDSAQVPKQFIQDYGAEDALNRVFHHMRKDKIAIINSADKKSGHVFNQFSSVDLSNRGLFKDLTDGLLLVEQLAAKFSGLTKENQEGGEKYQTATSVNRSIIASNSRIEVYFEPFDSYLGTIYTRTLQVCKSIYDEGEVFALTFGDIKNKFMSIHKDFFEADLGIYISNSAKNYRDKTVIDQAAQAALSNAQEPKLILDLIEVLENDSATESKAILARSVKALEELKKAESDQMKAIEDAKIKEQQDQRAWDGEQKEKDRQKDITVAKIQADARKDGDSDKIESAERIKSAEIQSQHELKEMENRQKQNEPAKEPATS